MFNNCLKQPGEEHTNSLVHTKSHEIIFKFLPTLEVLPFNTNAKHNLSRGLLFLVRLSIYSLNHLCSCLTIEGFQGYEGPNVMSIYLDQVQGLLVSLSIAQEDSLL